MKKVILRRSFLFCLLFFVLLLPLLAACDGGNAVGPAEDSAGNSAPAAQNQAGEAGESKNAAPELIDTTSFVNHSQMAEFISKTGDISEKEGRFIAAVVPHHMVAGHLTAETIAALVPQAPPLVIVIGPDHNNTSKKALTTAASWKTVAGEVACDTKAMDILLENGLAQTSDIFAAEHSIASIMPFIAYYLPEAKVLPIACNFEYSLDEARKLWTVLDPLIKDGAVIVASIDFSHGFSRADAEARDAKTRLLLENGDASEISRLRSEHLDAPIIMASLMEYAAAKGIKTPLITANTNSGVLMGNHTMECTSYFCLLY